VNEDATREALRKLYEGAYRKNISNPAALPAMPDEFIESQIKEIQKGTKGWDEHRALRRIERLRQLMT
jgi:hypothetical protein